MWQRNLDMAQGKGSKPFEDLQPSILSEMRSSLCWPGEELDRNHQANLFQLVVNEKDARELNVSQLKKQSCAQWLFLGVVGAPGWWQTEVWWTQEKTTPSNNSGHWLFTPRGKWLSCSLECFALFCSALLCVCAELRQGDMSTGKAGCREEGSVSVVSALMLLPPEKVTQQAAGSRPEL